MSTPHPPVNETVEQRLARLESFLQQFTQSAPPRTSLRTVLDLVGVGVLGSAIFFVGAMYSTVNQTENKVDTLIEGVTDPRDGLSTRLVAVQTRVTEIDDRLNPIDKKFTEVDRKLDLIEKKLDKLAEK